MTSWPLLLGIAPLALAAWHDGRGRHIPNRYTVAILVCAAINIICGSMALLDAVIGLVFIGLLMLFLAVVVDGGAAYGGGDVKLCASLGALIGVLSGLILIALAVLFLIIYGSVRQKQSLPVTPFLFAIYILIILGR